VTTASVDASGSIRIRVNGEERILPSGASVADLLSTLGLTPARVAVERNRGVVPRATHSETRLEAGDELEVVTFVGGG